MIYINNYAKMNIALDKHKDNFEIIKAFIICDLKSDIASYVACKYCDVSEFIHDEDKEVIEYLDNKFANNICNDFDDVMCCLESDIKQSSNNHLYEMVLNFLEANLINDYREEKNEADVSVKGDDNNENNDEENNVVLKNILFYLGKIYELKELIRSKRRIDETKLQNKILANEKSKPVDYKNYLDEYVVGQDKAKMVIAAAVYNHMKRLRNPELNFPTDVVLLIGPSGSGKTEIMRRVKEITKLPMVFTDISSLGVSQTKGRHKEDILISLINEAKGDVEKAQNGIIFLDEFDKILVPAFSSEGEDIHQRVQGQLLTMLEGSDVEIEYKKKKIVFNTSKVLFVLAGAFDGIEEFIKADLEKRDDTNIGIGFSATSIKSLDLSIKNKNINHKVLIDYGMKKELAGRIEDIAVLEELSKEDCLKVLTNAKDNVIERYKKEIKLMNNAELIFDSDALEAVVDKALDMKIGVRGMKSIISYIMRDILFEAPSNLDSERIVITKEMILGN